MGSPVPAGPPSPQISSLSHWRLWEHLKEQGQPYALILEDDILFAEGWKETLKKLPEYPEWDAYFLNAAEPLYPENTWLRVSVGLSSYSLLPEADCMTWWLQRQGHSYSRFPWPCIQECEDSTTGTDFAGNKAKLQQLLGPSLASYS